MKAGSLVELINDNWLHKGKNQDVDTIYPIKKKAYTVRDIRKNNGIHLCEIVNKNKQYIDGFGEKTFDIIRFRELQPPIANIEQHINENTLELQEL